MKRRNGVVIFALVAAASLLSTGAFLESPSFAKTAAKSAKKTKKTKSHKKTKPATELQIKDLKVGTGAEAVAGKQVTVNYTGWLTNGTKFDSSYDHGTPFTFPLGAGRVIQGWDQGVVGMKVGGKRKLTIPPQLAYGDRDLGKIPPNSTLVFEVELLKVE